MEVVISTRVLLAAMILCSTLPVVACDSSDSPTPTFAAVSAVGAPASPTPAPGSVDTPVAGTPAPVSPIPTAVPANTPVSGTRAAATRTPVREQTLTAPPTPVPPGPVSTVPMSPLMESLAVTPLAFADSPILFADYAGSRAATGLEGVQGIDDVLSALSTDNPRGNATHLRGASNWW